MLGCRQFFASGKVLPIERGAGLAQPAVALAAQLAGAGDWLHLFPEARGCSRVLLGFLMVSPHSFSEQS